MSREPASNWLLFDSGLEGVTTRHTSVRNQAECARLATGIIGNKIKVPLRKNRKAGTWNLYGLVQDPGKQKVIENEMLNHYIDIV